MILKKYYKTIIVLTFVLLLSLSPSSSVPKISFINIPQLDKFVHFFMYLSLAFISFIDIKKNIKKPTKLLILSVIFSFIVMSGIIEIIQENFISGRSGSYFDLLANILGIFCAGFIFYKTSIFAKFHRDH